MTLRNAFENLALDTTLQNVDTTIQSVKTSTDTVKTAVDSVTTAVGVTTQSISNLRNDVSTVNTSINTTNGQIKTSVDAVNNSVGGLSTGISNIKSSTDALLSPIQTVNTSVGTVKTSVDTVNTSVGTVNTSIAATNTALGNLNTSASDIKTSTDNVKNAVDQTKSAVNTVNNTLAGTVTTAINNVNTSVGTLTSSTDSIKTSTDTVKTSVDAVNTSVGTVKTSVDAVNTSVGTVKTSVDAVNTTLNAGIDTTPSNITTKFREAFDTFVNGVNWNVTQAVGDIVQLDGNAVSASYLVISKDPLRAGTETILESLATFDAPVELAVGLHMSQRISGHEVSMELVSTETSLTPGSDIAISSISQTTTTLTVNTVTPHGYSAGQRIGIRGVSDSRFNYAQLVVATVPSAYQFTATAGPAGTITSLTATGPNTSGYVYKRSSMGYARNGISEIFEGTSATAASVFVRSNSGDVLPSGTASGNHTLTVGSTSSQVPIAAANIYPFRATTEYRMNLQIDRATVNDVTIDNTGATSTRAIRTEIIPDINRQYKLRFRVVSLASAVIPNAQIVSAVKTASSTATVTTDVAHGLTTGDWIQIFGVRDQTNFAYNAAAFQVASVINSTQFTASWGATATATTYGGYVARINGNNVAYGNVTMSLQTIERVSNPDVIQVTLNTTGSGLTIGDYVNLVGVRDNTSGASLGLDGTYRVTDTFASTYRFEPIGNTTLPATLAVTNCGGAIIKRTDLRLSFVRIMDYVRQRVELLHRSDVAGAVGVNVTNTPAVTVSSGSITPINSNTYSLLTSTNLASSATYTGSTQTNYASSTSATMYFTQLVVGVTHTAGNAHGHLYVDYGTETSSTAPTTWYTGLAVPIPSNANMQYFTIPIFTRYYRLRFVNGATAQTNFRLSTVQTYNGGGLSGELSYPTHLLFPFSTTALAANGTFTAPSLDFGDTMNIYKTITAIVYADQASATNGFQIQVSRDNTNWRVASQATVTANTLTTISAPILYRYARLVYTNGATLQGSFALDANVEAV